jgi:hypothetical protein
MEVAIVEDDVGPPRSLLWVRIDDNVRSERLDRAALEIKDLRLKRLDLSSERSDLRGKLRGGLRDRKRRQGEEE